MHNIEVESLLHLFGLKCTTISLWSLGLVVRTLDFESNSTSSNLVETFYTFEKDCNEVREQNFRIETKQSKDKLECLDQPFQRLSLDHKAGCRTASLVTFSKVEERLKKLNIL